MYVCKMSFIFEATNNSCATIAKLSFIEKIEQGGKGEDKRNGETERRRETEKEGVRGTNRDRESERSREIRRENVLGIGCGYFTECIEEIIMDTVTSNLLQSKTNVSGNNRLAQ